MTKAIEKAIVVMLMLLCMPFLAAWFAQLIFGDLVLAFLIGVMFLVIGAFAIGAIYSDEKD